MELDVILETESGVIGMEVKARKGVASADLRAMREIANVLGKEWRGSLVIYLGDALRKVDDANIWAIPSRRLFL